MGVVLLDLLPDLSGQPPWVVIVVMVLAISGTLGLALIRRGRLGGDDEQGEEELDGARPPAVEGVPSSSVAVQSDMHTTMVIKQALDHLARVADREAQESEQARADTDRERREVRRLQDELLRCDRDRERLTAEAFETRAQLERCNAECRMLARRALGQGGDDGE